MAIIYRTSDPERWGEGKEARLTKVEIDRMMWTIVQRLTAVETNPPTPKEISNITLTGSQLSVHLSDGTIFGPYTLPVAVMHFRGEYAEATDYYELDIIHVPDVGLYLVLHDHTSVGPFDPVATGEGGVLYHQIMPTGVGGGGGGGGIDYAAGPVLVSNEWQLDAAWDGKYVVQDATYTTGEQNLYIELNADNPLPIGYQFIHHSKYRGLYIDFSPAGLVVNGFKTEANWIELPPGHILHFIKVGADEWNVLFLHEPRIPRSVDNYIYSSIQLYSSAQEDMLVRSTSTDPATNLIINVQPSPSYRIGESTYFRQVTERKIEVTPFDATITINPPFGKTLISAGPGASFKLTKVGENEWDCEGDMEPVA